MNADTRRGNRAAEAAAAGAETRDAPRSERPKYRTPSFEFDLARRNGQEPPPDAQRTFPVGTRLVMVANPVVQVEVLGFCPDGVEDELGEDAALDAYSVRFLDSGDTDLIPCYQVHDDLEFRRLSAPRGTDTCDNCGNKPDAGLLRCQGCKARYCNAECQRAKWKEHKPLCLQSRGEDVPADVFEAAQRAKASRLAREEKSAVRQISRGVVGEGSHRTNGPPQGSSRVVLMCTGMGVIDDMWAEAIGKSAEGSSDYRTVDVSTQEGCKSAARDMLRDDNLNAVILLGVGSAGPTAAEGPLNSAELRGALKQFVAAGGTVVLQGEGVSLKTCLVEWFQQDWGGGSQGYERHEFRTVVDVADGTWGSLWQRDAVWGISPKTDSVKAVTLPNVPQACRIFEHAHQSGTCAAAAGRFGKGTVAFFGDVNVEEPTVFAMAAMCDVSGQ